MYNVLASRLCVQYNRTIITHKLLKIKSAKLGLPIKEVIKVAIENL